MVGTTSVRPVMRASANASLRRCSSARGDACSNYGARAVIAVCTLHALFSPPHLSVASW